MTANLINPKQVNSEFQDLEDEITTPEDDLIEEMVNYDALISQSRDRTIAYIDIVIMRSSFLHPRIAFMHL